MNDDVADPVAIVGDVHGCVDRLDRALTILPGIAATIIFLGDYVDRGASSMQVLDSLCEARGTLGRRLRLLQGNHDAALLDFVASNRPFSSLADGGLATVRSYLPKAATSIARPIEYFRQSFPVRHRKLLEGLETHLETESLLASHAGFNPDLPADRSPASLVRGSYPDLFDPSVRGISKLAVFGHYVQSGRSPFIAPDRICLDTGCGTLPDGPLTALILPEYRFLQFR